MKKRFLGILFSLTLMLTMMPALGIAQTANAATTKTVTWSNFDFSQDITTEKDGVSLEGAAVYHTWDPSFITREISNNGEEITNGSFQTELGNFTRIEVTGGKRNEFPGTGDNWTGGIWTGNYPSVDIRGRIDDDKGNNAWTITFTIELNDPVSYLDENGNTQNRTEYCVVGDSDDGAGWGKAGKDSWYVVKGGNTNITGLVTVEGNVHLILCDNATLTINDPHMNDAIHVDTDSSLTIYAQSTADSMGRMIAAGINNGIRADMNSKITINGGEVNVSGGRGIFANDDITINNGKVTAKGSAGSGILSILGNITINNGTVIAESTGTGGSEDNFGIIVPYGGNCLTVVSGNLTASGTDGAIYGIVKNEIDGTGWTDKAGTKGQAPIAIDTKGRSLSYMKVKFPAESEPAPPSSAPAVKAPTVKTTASASAGSMTVRWTWDKVSGAKGYKVAYRKAGSRKWTYRKTNKTKYVVKGHKIRGLYEYKVAAVTGKGDVWSDVKCRYFNRVQAKAKAGKGTVKVSWKKDKSASGYQIKLAKNKKMKNAQVIKVDSSKRSYKISGLKKGKTYYVRVRPVKTRKGNTYTGILSNTCKVRVN